MDCNGFIQATLREISRNNVVRVPSDIVGVKYFLAVSRRSIIAGRSCVGVTRRIGNTRYRRALTVGVIPVYTNNDQVSCRVVLLGCYNTRPFRWIER